MKSSGEILEILLGVNVRARDKNKVDCTNPFHT